MLQISLADSIQKKSRLRHRMIYIPIGEKHETSFYNVERGIRVVVDKCWKEDKELMMEILGYHAIKCPSNSEFLDAFTFFCENR